MRLGVVQFTCPEDAECTEVSLESVERVCERHKGLDVVVRPISREGGRGTHLNGLEAVREELGVYAKMGEEGCDWVLKLDSDTLWLGASFLDRLSGPWALIGAGDQVTPKPSGDVYPYIRGHGYLLKPWALRHLPREGDAFERLMGGVDHFCSGYPSRHGLPHGWPEDEAISGLVRYALGSKAVLAMPLQCNVPWVSFWPFGRLGVDGCSQAMAKEMAGRSDFIEFGRTAGYRDDVEDRATRRKEFTARAMRHFLEQIS